MKELRSLVHGGYGHGLWHRRVASTAGNKEQRALAPNPVTSLILIKIMGLDLPLAKHYSCAGLYTPPAAGKKHWRVPCTEYV